MSAAPEHFRAARTPIPRLPFPAILLFTGTGLGGALFLTYTSSFTSAEPLKAAAAPVDYVSVYSVPAVPFDATPESVAAHAAASAPTAPTAPSEPRQTATTAESDSSSVSSEPVLFAEATREFKGFNRFSQFGSASNFATVTQASFGMIAQTNAPVYLPPDGDFISAPVPEPSTWFCGVALLTLLLTRGLHASWHRNQRRTANKTDSARH
jgi:hypothetical protein